MIALGAAVAAQALVLWNATGRAAWTRYYDADRAAREAEQESLADLFEGTGIHDAHGELEEIPNRFALGMLPSGADRHVVSVLTIGGPGALMMVGGVVGLVFGGKGKKEG